MGIPREGMVIAKVFGPGVFLILQHRIDCIVNGERWLLLSFLSIILTLLGWLCDFLSSACFFFFSSFGEVGLWEGFW